MLQDLSYEKLLETSHRINWRVDDVMGSGTLDFSKPFLPESFARVQGLTFLTPDEQIVLNQIRGHGYLAMFELVERTILPFISEHAPSAPGQDPWRSPALAQFAAEEAKHIELFVRFRRAFAEGFGSECGFIGPAEAIGEAVRAHSKLGLAMFVLGIEMTTLVHYVESVRDAQELDPQFKSLLRHHWMEEAQHARLDAMLFHEMAERATPEKMAQGLDDFLDIGAFIDGGLKGQVELDLVALETAIGRTLGEDQRDEFRRVQLQAQRWTFLGSAMVNRDFLDAVGAASPEARARIEQVAPAFC